jgi:hypothetical protein
MLRATRSGRWKEVLSTFTVVIIKTILKKRPHVFKKICQPLTRIKTTTAENWKGSESIPRPELPKVRAGRKIFMS